MPRKTHKQITVIIGLVIHDGKILMVKRHEPEVPGAHLKWEYPGGKVDIGETPEQAIIREIREETGVIVDVKRLLPCVVTTNWEYPWGIQQTLIFGFECTYISEEKRFHDHHVQNVEWVAIKKLFDRESLPGSKEFFEALNL